MRFLFVTNLYPPHARGGYERWCQEVARALVARGHELLVVTSLAPGAPPTREEEEPGLTVERALERDVVGGLASTVRRLIVGRERRERAAIERLDSVVAAFEPDAALAWGMWNLPRTVPARLETLLGDRLAYYLCDYWPTLPSAALQQLENPADHARSAIPKRLLAMALAPGLRREPRPALRLDNAICVSEAVRERLAPWLGVSPRVIHGGIDVGPYLEAARERQESGLDEPLRLLYVGRLDEEKGVLTAVESIARLAPQERERVTLDLVGRGMAAYERALRERIAATGLGDRVQLAGAWPGDEMPYLYAAYDVLIFPSEWPEPFARTLLEGMASGLLVIGTTTGGSGEILEHGVSGLSFAAGDSGELAARIRHAIAHPDERQRLAAEGRRRVVEGYTFDRMVAQLETALVARARGEAAHV